MTADGIAIDAETGSRFFVSPADRRIGLRFFRSAVDLSSFVQHTTLHLPADTGRDRIPTGKGAFFQWKLTSTFWRNEKP
ncbi:hypothetical protein EZV77_02840 [Burkholderia thailandensis]|nr:hypothetical protein A8H31_24655 [Burkholderia thailandensis]AVR27167.1 hypothetical protein A8H32_17650 [Burkholderia thailandensis]AWY60505.1 hypothetical protein A8H35_17850 [Burkholderia thailandensis]AWY69616.1 hypothetical protein A8H36_29415 [Burkholderia thailandensis]MDD1483507.1 hypothetical protein [Burkholderia thailandensis]